METWMIVVLVAAVAVVVWAMMKRQTIPASPAPVLLPQYAAPGLVATTGQMITSPALPPPADTVVPKTTIAQMANMGKYQFGYAMEQVPAAQASPSVFSKLNAYKTSSVLQNVPIIGGVAATAMRAPASIASYGNAKVTTALQHIPVVGKALAVPNQIAGKIGSALTSWF